MLHYASFVYVLFIISTAVVSIMLTKDETTVTIVNLITVCIVSVFDL